jgi:hypothetical protein
MPMQIGASHLLDKKGGLHPAGRGHSCIIETFRSDSAKFIAEL